MSIWSHQQIPSTLPKDLPKVLAKDKAIEGDGDQGVKCGSE